MNTCAHGSCPVQTPRRYCYFHSSVPRRSTEGMTYCPHCHEWRPTPDVGSALICCGRTPPKGDPYRLAYNAAWMREKRAKQKSAA